MDQKYRQFVEERVHVFYWKFDQNCATSNLKLLAEYFDIELDEQVVDAALGMHGAGKYRAQCGLVEGGLMFIGLIGRHRSISDELTVQACYDFAQQFEARFGSLTCRELRPEGFPPELAGEHICEQLTVDAVVFSVEFVEDFIERAEKYFQ